MECCDMSLCTTKECLNIVSDFPCKKCRKKQLCCKFEIQKCNGPCDEPCRRHNANGICDKFEDERVRR